MTEEQRKEASDIVHDIMHVEYDEIRNFLDGEETDDFFEYQYRHSEKIRTANGDYEKSFSQKLS